MKITLKSARIEDTENTGLWKQRYSLRNSYKKK